MEPSAHLDLINALVVAVGSALIALATFGIRWIYLRIRSELLDRALQAVVSAAHLAVREVWTCYVEELKASAADGKLTDAEKQEARERAIELIRSFVGRKGLALLVREFGFDDANLERFLGSSVEQALAAEKSAGAMGEVA